MDGDAGAVGSCEDGNELNGIVLLLIAEASQAADWATPATGGAGIVVVSALVRWLMTTITRDNADLRREMNENARSLEKALYFNTQASHFIVLAIDEASIALKGRVKIAEEQLTRHESERAAQIKTREDHGGRQ